MNLPDDNMQTNTADELRQIIERIKDNPDEMRRVTYNPLVNIVLISMFDKLINSVLEIAHPGNQSLLDLIVLTTENLPEPQRSCIRAQVEVLRNMNVAGRAAMDNFKLTHGNECATHKNKEHI